MKIWITSLNKEEDQKHLESLGIKVEKWEIDPHANKPHHHPGRGQFTCEIDKAALDKLQAHWGERYVWGLLKT